MRTDLNMRKGKMIVQGAHAAQEWLINKVKDLRSFTDYEIEWLTTGTTKICVGINNEEELMTIYEQGKSSNLPTYLITDLGLTEFEKPTKTCVAIGPALSEKIDKITGGLKLL